MPPKAPSDLEVRVVQNPQRPGFYIWQVIEDGKGPIDAATTTYATEKEAWQAGTFSLERLREGRT